jgi:hypothetical protein
MKNILIKKLHDYLIQNNPDVLASLQEEGKVPYYLEDKVEALDDLIAQLQAEKKPAYIIEEICMDVSIRFGASLMAIQGALHLP